MKNGAKFIPVILGAGIGSAVSLLALAVVGDFGIMLLSLLASILATAFVVIVVATGIFRNRRYFNFTSVSALVAFVAAVALIVPNQYRLRPTLTWFAWSRQYKGEVLARPASMGELQHIEWDGDGWGSGATGDWMGYVVFDPSDSLSRAASTHNASMYQGIPCRVVRVCRLEKHWYSVVLDMNQFWDSTHKKC